MAEDAGALLAHPASYRDPGARVFVSGERILRLHDAAAAGRHRQVAESGLFASLVGEGLLVAGQPVDLPRDAGGPAFALEHERIAFISYPYEWPFALLKRAALLHLDVHLRALEHGCTLTDASAFNVQFRGVRPVFIDWGSFRRYEPGELWAGHRQFCEQFLNPLLLAAECGVDFHPWLRGSLEGIPTAGIAALLPARRWLSWRHALHVLLPARMERSAARDEARANARIRAARLPLEGLRGMLRQLRGWIERLALPGADATTWADYGAKRTYTHAENEAKRAFVADFAARTRPRQLWDFGCNDGEYGAIALAAGASSVIGFDSDGGALERACARATRDGLDLLPLVQDAADPSPARGWRGRERSSLAERGAPDAVMALAFAHHLAIGRNVPLDDVVGWIASIAPRGVLEFVPKSDPTVQRMLALKGDIFPGYGEAAFVAALERGARVVRREVVSASGRALYEFAR
jgi:ribosomal protein L11 methylase PrmA